MKDRWLSKEDMKVYKHAWYLSHKKRTTSRTPNGPTTFNKCLREGCETIVKQTAYMKRHGAGLYCSQKHKGLSEWNR